MPEKTRGHQNKYAQLNQVLDGEYLARQITLSSSRTFPGQECSNNCSMAASSICMLIPAICSKLQGNRQLADVLRPLSQRRDTDVEGIQAIQKILSELAALN